MLVAKLSRWAVLLAVTSCYAPQPPEGSACTADKMCPDPLFCSFGVCVADVPPCIPIDDGSGKLTIPKLPQPIVLDGDLADWPTCFITVDLTTAGLVRDLGAFGKFAPGRFSIAAAADQLYVAAEVTSVPPLGNQPPPAIYKNNAISVYFDGDGTFATANYDPDAAQIVVDHANREQAFHTGGLLATPDVRSAAATGPTTFTIEMAVDANSFGLAAFGSRIGFDIGLVGGDGSVMTSELVWFQACAPPACACNNGDAAPYCDAREMGTATFAP
jgi:Carbohydrate family 9 binding domain-like